MISWRILPLIFSLARGSTWNYGHCYERMENLDTCYDPEHWGSHYDSCRGEAQSPIDISDPVKANLGRIKFTNFAKYFNDIEIENNGHSLQLNKLNKGFFRLLQPKFAFTGGELKDEYIFQQLHFHWGDNSKIGSEHRIRNVTFPLEMHLVHYNSKYGDFRSSVQHQDGLVVLSVLFKISPFDNKHLQPIMDASRKLTMPGATTNEDDFVESLDLRLERLLPKNTQSYFTYFGSLTTPPCSEVVTWIIFADILEVSERQMKQFRLLRTLDPAVIKTDVEGLNEIADNFRPIQKKKGRVVQLNVL